VAIDRRTVLLDTGPIVALLDAADTWHERCVEVWRTIGTRCITTEAVVTEASHLVQRGRAPAALPLEFLIAAQVPVLGLDVANRRYAARLMRRFTDLPMDYADATLVALGDALQIGSVFTIDRRGFAVYRLANGRAFRILPES
jgi:predicted nucleic acid-binding protein